MEPWTPGPPDMNGAASDPRGFETFISESDGFHDGDHPSGKTLLLLPVEETPDVIRFPRGDLHAVLPREIPFPPRLPWKLWN